MYKPFNLKIRRLNAKYMHNLNRKPVHEDTYSNKTGMQKKCIYQLFSIIILNHGKPRDAGHLSFERMSYVRAS